MIYPDLIFSLLVAVVLCGLFVLLIRKKEARRGFYLLFVIIFLATWAGGVWGGHLGPRTWGIYWVPYVLAGLAITILLWFIMPKRPEIKRDAQLNRKQTREMINQIEEAKQMEKLVYVSLNLFVLIFLALLVAAILLHYFRIKI